MERGYIVVKIDNASAIKSKHIKHYLTVDFISGAFLIIIGAGAIVSSANLELGQLARPGPAIFIWLNSVLLAAIGAALCVFSTFTEPVYLAQWPVRGILFVTAGILSFSLMLHPLGMLATCFLSFIISGLATAKSRPPELLVSGAVMALLCAGTFALGLDLPIPLFPTIF